MIKGTINFKIKIKDFKEEKNNGEEIVNNLLRKILEEEDLNNKITQIFMEVNFKKMSKMIFLREIIKIILMKDHPLIKDKMISDREDLDMIRKNSKIFNKEMTNLEIMVEITETIKTENIKIETFKIEIIIENIKIEIIKNFKIENIKTEIIKIEIKEKRNIPIVNRMISIKIQ